MKYLRPLVALLFLALSTALGDPVRSQDDVAQAYLKHLDAYNKDLDVAYWIGKKLLSKELEQLCVKSKGQGPGVLFLSSDSIPGFVLLKTEFAEEVAKIHIGHKTPEGTPDPDKIVHEVLILIPENGAWRLDDIHFMDYEVEGKASGRFTTLRDQFW